MNSEIIKDFAKRKIFVNKINLSYLDNTLEIDILKKLNKDIINSKINYPFNLINVSKINKFRKYISIFKIIKFDEEKNIYLTELEKIKLPNSLIFNYLNGKKFEEVIFKKDNLKIKYFIIIKNKLLNKESLEIKNKVNLKFEEIFNKSNNKSENKKEYLIKGVGDIKYKEDLKIIFNNFSEILIGEISWL